jgi:hypothetical protein
MNRLATLLPVALAAAVLGISVAGADPNVHRAFGSGRIAIPQESVNFNAFQDADGTSRGVAVVHDFSAGVTAHIEVNCLNVFGNTAIVSGIVVRSTDPTLNGFRGIFEVVDGEATGTPDLMSPVNFFLPEVGPDCTVPGEFDLQPIENGNITVQ